MTGIRNTKHRKRKKKMTESGNCRREEKLGDGYDLHLQKINGFQRGAVVKEVNSQEKEETGKKKKIVSSLVLKT